MDIEINPAPSNPRLAKSIRAFLVSIPVDLILAALFAFVTHTAAPGIKPDSKACLSLEAGSSRAIFYSWTSLLLIISLLIAMVAFFVVFTTMSYKNFVKSSSSSIYFDARLKTPILVYFSATVFLLGMCSVALNGAHC